jgi:hypothetical protein
MKQEPWHLSKSVPLTLVLAIACQTVALIWFVATLRNDVDTNRNNLSRLEGRTMSVESLVQRQAISIARMDENIKAIRSAVEKMADRSTEAR